MNPARVLLREAQPGEHPVVANLVSFPPETRVRMANESSSRHHITGNASLGEFKTTLVKGGGFGDDCTLVVVVAEPLVPQVRARSERKGHVGRDPNVAFLAMATYTTSI
jgi:hypothetical protein